MPDTGLVILVGAGPGDPGLLTLAGKTAIEKADVVLYDRLVGEEILAMAPAAAVRIDVGKRKGSHPVPQEEINRLLVAHARMGKTVVRLKGGDPYLFGRGAEELENVARAGIPFRVVPGVTSAVAVPAYAGIPVTHRDHASSLHIFTGHGRDGSEPDIPFREVARLKGTLVFLMGLSMAGRICGGLVRAGMDGETPAAMIANGTRSDQRRLSGTLATLPGLLEAENFPPPALLIVGSVAALAGVFDWTARLPLWGRRVLVAGSTSTGGRLASGLRAHGCGVDEFAAIVMEPLPVPDSLLLDIGRYAWVVLTSRFGAALFFERLSGLGLDARHLAGVRFAAVGERTGMVLTEHGVKPDFMPTHSDGRTLGEELSGLTEPGEEVLLYRAGTAGADLPAILRQRGLAVDDIAAYRTVVNPPPPELLAAVRAGRYDAAAFTSASSVAGLAAALAGDVPPLSAVCIGETTSAAARRCGLAAVVSPVATIESMVETIIGKAGMP